MQIIRKRIYEAIVRAHIPSKLKKRRKDINF